MTISDLSCVSAKKIDCMEPPQYPIGSSIKKIYIQKRKGMPINSRYANLSKNADTDVLMRKTFKPLHKERGLIAAAPSQFLCY